MGGITLQKVFSKKLRKAFFFELPKEISRLYIKKSNEHQTGIEQTDTHEVAQGTEVGHTLGRVVEDTYGDILHRYTTPCCTHQDFYLELELTREIALREL